MKKIALLLSLLAPLAIRAADPYLVLLPLSEPSGTYPFVWTNAVFWTNPVPPVEIEAWQMARAFNTNMMVVSNGIHTLAGIFGDGNTNVMLNSCRSQSASTNLVHVDAGTTNVMPWTFPSYAGVTYSTTLGSPTALYSTDGGTTWIPYAEGLVTNVPVKLAFKGGWTRDMNLTQIPLPAEITNVVAYTLARPDLFGRTNIGIGERMLVGTPWGPDDATPKSYVDNLFQATPWWSAGSDIYVNSHDLKLSPTWEIGTATTTNQQFFSLKYLGETVLTAWQSNAVNAGVISIAMDGSGTNVVVTEGTNGLAVPPRLQFSHLLNPILWTWLTNTPAIVGTNYVWTFPFPYTDSGFLMSMKYPTNAATVAVSGNLSASGVISGNSIAIDNPPWQPAASNLTSWAGIAPASKQDALGYTPLTNTAAAITNALGATPVAQATHAASADSATAASGGWPANKTLLTAYSTPGQIISSSSPFYTAPAGSSGSTTEASVSIPLGPTGWVATNLYVKLLAAFGSGTNITVTMMTNGSASGFAATISGGGATGNSSSSSVNIPTNATVSLRFTCNAVTTVKPTWMWTLELR